MSFPQMNGVLWNWTDALQFNVVALTAENFQAVERLVAPIAFDGCVVPLPTRQLLIKPEGERQWKWWTLYTEQELEPDSILQDETGSYYRVVKKSNWSGADYFEYEITQAPAPPYAGS